MRGFALSVAALLVAFHSVAQDRGTKSVQTEESTSVHRAAAALGTHMATSVLGDPTQRTLETDARPEIAFVVSEEEKTVVAKIGYVFQSMVASLKVSGPAASSGKDAELANLEGLTNQAVADAGATWVFWSPDIHWDTWDSLCADVRSQISIDERLERGGYLFGRASFRERDPFIRFVTEARGGAPLAKVRERLVRSLSKVENIDRDLSLYLTEQAARTIGGWDEILDLLNSYLADPTLFTGTSFSSPEAVGWQERLQSPGVTTAEVSVLNRLLLEDVLGPAVLRLSPEDTESSQPCSLKNAPEGSPLKSQLTRQLERSRPLILAARAKVGRRSFEYLDGVSPKEATKSGYSLSIGLGLLTSGTTYLGVLSSYQRAYRAADAREFCFPTEIGGVSECRELGESEPALKREMILQGLLRRNFRALGHQMALAATAGFEMKESIKAIELKLYVFQEEKKGLRGGIAGGWRSDTNDVTVTAFIGQAFDLVPGL